MKISEIVNSTKSIAEATQRLTTEIYAQAAVFGLNPIELVSFCMALGSEDISVIEAAMRLKIAKESK
jgi:hypothetical protein